MSKRAEQAALKAYPEIATVPKMVNVEDGTIYDANASKRKYFMQGYEQAEKDLALTWEYVAKIITIYEAGIDNGDYLRYNEAKWMKEYSRDILRRFNEMKEKKK